MEPQTGIQWLIRALTSEDAEQRVFAGNAVEDWIERYSDAEIDLLVRLLAYMLPVERDTTSTGAWWGGWSSCGTDG
jgi:hypothetical protein